MTAANAALSKSEFYKLRTLNLERCATVPEGSIMFCQNKKVLAIRDLANFGNIPSAANTACLSLADYDVVNQK